MLIDYSEPVNVVRFTGFLVIRWAVSTAIQAFLAVKRQVFIAIGQNVTTCEHLDEIFDIALVKEPLGALNLAIAKLASSRALHLSIATGLSLCDVL